MPATERGRASRALGGPGNRWTVPVTALHGETVIRRGEPPIEEHRDACFVPMSAEAGHAWGVYDSAGRLIEAATLHRGPQRHRMMQPDAVMPEHLSPAADAPEDSYIYIGPLHLHYGHFLCSSLSRLWSLPGREAGVRLLYHGAGYVGDWWSVPHVAFCLSALGVGPEDIVQFDRPTRIRRLVVPSTAFEELHFAHRAFATVGNLVGASAAAGQTRDCRPVYFSKARLQSGVWRFTNEAEVEAAFAREGYDVVDPQALPLAEQVALFRDRPLVVGTTSSLMHTAILVARCAPMLSYGFKSTIDSNYTLIDAVNGNWSSYVRPRYVRELGQGGEFSLNVELVDPGRLAGDLLRRADHVMRGPARMSSSTLYRAEPSRRDLNAIGLQHGTGQASHHHDFLAFYERFVQRLRDEPECSLLEIGVFEGASLRTWAEYFHRGRIVGVDIDPAALEHRGERVAIEIADQSDVLAMVDVALRHGPFDVVVDDGSHGWDHQITSFRTLFPYLKPNGVYIVVNLDTSYGTLAPEYKGVAETSTAAYLQAMCDYMVADRVMDLSREPDAFIRSFAPAISAMAFHRRTCVIERRAD